MATINELIKAIKEGQTIGVIQGLITQLLNETEGVNTKYNNGDTALHWAAADGRQDIVGLLLQQKGIDVNLQNEDGDTALIWAAFEGHQEIVQLLVAKGAKINERDNEGATALHLAAFNGHTEVVQKLLQQPEINVNLTDNDGYTALHAAAYKWHTEVVELLLQNGAAITKAIDLHLLQQICGEGKPIAEQTASGEVHEHEPGQALAPALVGEASADTAEDALNP
jgi:ankyrin repeat protein